MTSIGKKDKERKVDWRKVKVQDSYWLHCSIFFNWEGLLLHKKAVFPPPAGVETK